MFLPAVTEPSTPALYDVAIVGLGPVGATLAALLGGRGLRVVVLERETTPHTLPRAAHLDGEALRILDAAGAPAAHLGRPLDGFDLVDAAGRLLLRGRPSEGPPPGFPAGVLIHQPDVESVLRSRLSDLATVDVRHGHAVEQVEERTRLVTIRGRRGDEPFEVRSSFAVGCDGAASRVREVLGAELVGRGFEQRWLVVDTLLMRPVDLPSRLLQIADPRRPTTFVPFPDPRRRWEFKLTDDEDADAIRQPAAVRALLAPHVAPNAVEVERAAIYTFHDLVARPWRRGRLLIAGDAAHQMPPFLGQGLGAGLRDAWALAPLLAGVAGGAPAESLDTYEAVRRLHVEAVVRQAVRLGRLVTLPPPLATLRDGALRLAHRVPILHRPLLDVRG